MGWHYSISGLLYVSFGYKSEITTFPDSSNPDILAYIELGEPTLVTADEQMLFDAIFN
ncbi:hypothetical protein [Chlorogloeopsis sp. ULAP02]|uniref:hypothetical protein n=1 Tax=Chlorogloeopsis sp. ULAP02 TaxID=3107926 RepID=UPI003137654E